MNHCAKRSRQMTLFECFNQTENIVGDKKSESGKMNSVTEESETPKAEMRELLASAAEKRMGVEVEATSRVEEDGTGELMESGGISSLLNNFDDLLTNTNASGDLPWVNSASSTEQNDVALNRWPECGATLPPLKPSDEHTIMFRPHLLEGCAPRPFPDEYRDKWDGDHVRMPCSPLNRYPVESLGDGHALYNSDEQQIFRNNQKVNGGNKVYPKFNRNLSFDLHLSSGEGSSPGYTLKQQFWVANEGLALNSKNQ